MTSRSLSWKVSGLVFGAVFALAGCGPADDGGGSPTGSVTNSASASGVATDVPAGYNPCTDIPQSVLDSEKLRNRGESNSNADGGVKWRGCRFGRSDGYVASITTTNLTIDKTRQRNFADAKEFSVAGRQAISTRQVADHPEAACVVNVEIKGGSLDINLSNPPSNRETGQIDSCVLARTLAEKIVPTMPASV
ncbi:DUF3558 domain-containing protein [Nocardia sp. XZ_19_369]|uniref:DUF3558 domain-containing protein n=1 Tax=Nocardia sp. XZ_19_369 TaxID=2769487 RepID=UPI00188EBAF9|nr:DUF3558 domain-containing protein [Nocardia sp. XZ_19_369]